MVYKKLHEWNLSPKEAVEIQRELRKKLQFIPFEGEPKYVAGVDLSFPRSKEGLAVVVVLEYPSFKIVELATERGEVPFPYIPGLLAFREGPLFLRAWEKLKIRPDVVVFDGQGIAHPRKLGIASHMGLFIEIPTIGVAKSRLYGSYAEPENKACSWSYLYDNEGIIGCVMRTKEGSAPIFVSPGHLIDVESSMRLIKSFTLPGKRIPEPTRLAHIYTQRLKRSLF
ncbi:endonuclease V [Thermotoga sp. KOL6]|uniref:endonuclease V n=1 Tax=Thermotoga sp. KOL6 TaxID=126741 RepID=UPI000C786587|nr:endonuclease V [Thermotoga sp. KOL6]PLV60411.1 endonuclease V [Thermotoga sp. KOL6]